MINLSTGQIYSGTTAERTANTGFQDGDRFFDEDQNLCYYRIRNEWRAMTDIIITEPKNPFGSLWAERRTKIAGGNFAHGIRASQFTTRATGSGAVTVADNQATIATGNTVNSTAQLESIRRVRCQDGQGSIGVYTASFSAGANNSYQIAGIGTVEGGVWIGKKDDVLSVGRTYGGKREVQTLTVTTGATGAGNVTVTLDGTAFSVPVTIGATTQTAWEIAKYAAFTGWKAEPRGATVLFICDSIGNKSGTFSFGAGGTGAAASFAETRAGASLVGDLWTPQSNWNGYKFLGGGEYDATIDPTKGRPYKVEYQCLGYGPIKYYAEHVPANNAQTWVNLHTDRYVGLYEIPSLSNPSAPFMATAYSVGSTTNLNLKVASVGGFTEGEQFFTGSRATLKNTSTAVTAANYRCLFSFYNSRYFAGVTNQIVIYVLSAAAAVKHTQPVEIVILKNCPLSAYAGVPNFAQFDTDSPIWWDTAATTVTPTSNLQEQFTLPLAETGNELVPFKLNIDVQPGDLITAAAKAVTGTPAYVFAALNTVNDE